MEIGTKEPEAPRITVNTLFSFQVIVILIGLATWIIRLGDKVDHHEALSKSSAKKHDNYETRIYLIEERLKMKHITLKDEGEN